MVSVQFPSGGYKANDALVANHDGDELTINDTVDCLAD